MHIQRLRGVALVLAVGIALAAVVEAASSFGFGGSGAAGLASAAVIAGIVVICLVAWRGAPART